LTVTSDIDKGMVLQGETLAVLVRSGAARDLDLPAEVGGRPGPAFLVVVRTAPAEYELLGRGGLGLFLARPARIGVRPALSVVFGVVADEQTCLRLRSGLGLPLEVGTLSWCEDERRRELQWKEGDLSVAVRAGHLGFPVMYTGRLAQCRADGPIIVPTRLSGLARTGKAVVETGGDAPLSCIRGRHRGATLATARLVTRGARQPVGVLSSLRAPVLGPGPVGRGAGRPAEIDSLTAVS
jgi:hypothetical protein